MVTWALAQFQTTLNGIATMSVPYMPPIEMSLIDMLKQTPETASTTFSTSKPVDAEKELEADPIETMRANPLDRLGGYRHHNT